jgi:CRISPR type III-A-associated protein Csm2
MPPPTEESLSDRLRRLGYFDAGGNLRSELVARDSIAPLAEDMRNASPPLTMNQMRRFFQHCRAIEARLRARTSSWEAERTRHFATLDRAAADAIGKSPPKIPQMFHDFIQHNVAAVRTEKDFLEGFLPHFEALVGFGKFSRERDRS